MLFWWILSDLGFNIDFLELLLYVVFWLVDFFLRLDVWFFVGEWLFKFFCDLLRLILLIVKFLLVGEFFVWFKEGILFIFFWWKLVWDLGKSGFWICFFLGVFLFCGKCDCFICVILLLDKCVVFDCCFVFFGFIWRLCECCLECFNFFLKFVGGWLLIVFIVLGCCL